MADYRGYGKAHDAAAADDRHSDDRRHRQRGAELRRHRRRRDAHEDGVRRSVGGVPGRDPRSRADRAPRRGTSPRSPGFDAIAHAVETAVTTRRTPLSDTFSHQAWRLLAGAFERVLAASGRHRSARGDAARRALRRHGHRAVDARRRARLRQSADRPLQPHARPRARDPAAARRPLERPGRRRCATRRCSARRPPRPRRRAPPRRWRGGSRTSRVAGGLPTHV